MVRAVELIWPPVISGPGFPRDWSGWDFFAGAVAGPDSAAAGGAYAPRVGRPPAYAPLVGRPPEARRKGGVIPRASAPLSRPYCGEVQYAPSESATPHSSVFSVPDVGFLLRRRRTRAQQPPFLRPQTRARRRKRAQYVRARRTRVVLAKPRGRAAQTRGADGRRRPERSAKQATGAETQRATGPHWSPVRS